MVDAEDLRFIEVAAQRVADLDGAGQVVSDRLFDYHPREILVVWIADQSGLVQALDRIANRFGWNRKIESPVRRNAARLLDFLKALAQTLKAVGLVETAQVVELVFELTPARVLDLES